MLKNTGSLRQFLIFTTLTIQTCYIKATQYLVIHLTHMHNVGLPLKKRLKLM